MDSIGRACKFIIVLSTMFTLVLSTNVCNNNTSVCIRKCCRENQILKNQTCVFGDSPDLNPLVYKNKNVTEDSSAKLQIVYNSTKCLEEKVDFVKREFFVQNDGKLWVSSKNRSFSYEEYCLEYFENDGMVAILCSVRIVDNSKVDKVTMTIAFIGMMISLPLLLITFLVYAVLPNRSLHGMCLMSYVFALFWAFFLPVIIYNFVRNLSAMVILCRAIMMPFYFFAMASFFWMNVMCIDIWLTFSGTRGFSTNKKQTERRRFFIYSSYAWGLPLLLIAVMFSISNLVSEEAWYNPGISGEGCWIKDGLPQLLFLYGPVAIIIVVNISLFCVTAWKIRQVKKQTAVLTERESKKHSENADKQRFGLYIKLLFAMGLNWSMEVIPWAISMLGGNIHPAVFYLSEFGNAAFGVFIFFIFVFKKSIWRSLKTRYYKMTGKNQTVDSCNTTEMH